MRFQKVIVGLAAAAALLAFPHAARAQEGGPRAVPEEFRLYVQTHFSQGWSLGLLDLFPRISAPGFRDGIYWRSVEKEPGQYDLSRFAPYFEAARRQGLEPLVVFAGAHPAYDDGTTPYTDEGRRAFARYVAAVVAAYPDVIQRLEIGNEYNTNGFLSGPFEDDPGRYFGPLAKEVAKAVKAEQPDTEIICTGAHSVATGYLRKAFESGALEHCDAISFHPYRDAPENVDVEIARLRALMREFGGEKPLYVTEFGDWFEDPRDAPDFMLKMVSMMGAAGVSGAYWYALLDEKHWPNMGLFTSDLEEKPAAATFRLLQNELLPLGRPVARGKRREDHLYEFGQVGRAFVAWGAPGELHVEGPAAFFDSKGRRIDPVRQLSDTPVVIVGEGIKVSIHRDRPVHSAFLGYGAAPWSYFAVSRDAETWPFKVMDGNWNPYLGHPDLDRMSVTPVKVVTGYPSGQPAHVVERFTAPRNGTYEIHGRWFREKPDADGADIRISRNGEVLATGVVSDAPFEWRVNRLELEAGDTLDFAVGPNREWGGDYVRREITVTGP